MSINKIAGRLGSNWPTGGSLEAIESIARRLPGELLISKRKLRQAEAVQLVRLKRESANQNLGFASRPFVLCGLPIKRLPKGELMHERRNGQFVLQVTGHPTYGVPWGQDRLVPIFLATLAMRQQRQSITFRTAAEMLDVFGIQQSGSHCAGSSRLSSEYLANHLLWYRGNLSCAGQFLQIRVGRAGPLKPGWGPGQGRLGSALRWSAL